MTENESGRVLTRANVDFAGRRVTLYHGDNLPQIEEFPDQAPNAQLGLFVLQALLNYPQLPRVHRPLSLRETEVLGLVAQDFGNIEIGKKLAISVKTVEAHKTHIKQKLGSSVSALMASLAFALRPLVDNPLESRYLTNTVVWNGEGITLPHTFPPREKDILDQAARLKEENPESPSFYWKQVDSRSEGRRATNRAIERLLKWHLLEIQKKDKDRRYFVITDFALDRLSTMASQDLKN